MSWEKLKIDDFTPGLTLVDGKNGNGKSGIWDGPGWCIFGETIRGVKNDEVVNRRFKKDCFVRFVFSNRGDHFDVCRYRLHSGRDDGGKRFSNRLVVVYTPRGGKPQLVEKGTVADTQKWLLDTLGIDFQLYSCTVVYAQEDTFNFVNETDKNQKEILGKVRKVDFSSALVKARAALKANNDKLDEIQHDLDILSSHCGDERINNVIEKRDTFEEDRKERVNNLKKEIRVKLAEIKSAKVSDVEKLNIEKTKLFENGRKIGSLIVELEKERAVIVSDASGIKLRLDTFDDLEGVSECSSCLQEIPHEHIDKVKADCISRLTELEKKAGEKTKQIKKWKMEENDVEKAYNAIERKISEASSQKARIAGMKSTIMVIKERMDEAANDINPFIKMIEDEREKQKKIVKKMRELKIKKRKFMYITPYLSFWERGFSDKGLKSFLFDSLCGDLTNKTNDYINILTNGEMTISFDTQSKLKTGETREKFECIINIDGEKVPYRAYSGGEKTRISLAVDLALADLMNDFYGSEFNFLVMDEQDVFVDDAGRQAYMQLLKSKANDRRVFVVSHDAKFKSEFDDVIRVTRDGTGTSKIA